METFNTFVTIVKEKGILALTLFCNRIILSTIIAILALEAFAVIFLIWTTLNTSLTIEEWFLCGTKHAGL
jgi:hypothetical protein